MKVAVVYNEPVHGRPDSDDILDEVGLITASLNELGYDHLVFPLGDVNKSFTVSESIFYLLLGLKKYSPHVIFNIVEGIMDNPDYQYCMPLVFEHSNYLFTGSGHEAILTTTDKVISKRIMDTFKIPTPPYQEYRGRKLSITIPPPWIRKPAIEDASVGIDENAFFRDMDSLMDDLPLSYSKYGNRPLIVEQYIDGREFNVSLLEKRDGTVEVLPVAEMLFEGWPEEKPMIVGYSAKWDKDSFEYRHTIRSFGSNGLPLDAIRDTALKCWKVFNIKGYARVDMRMDGDGRLYVIEVNTNPCIAPDSGLIAAAKEAGYEPSDIVKELIEVAAEGDS